MDQLYCCKKNFGEVNTRVSSRAGTLLWVYRQYIGRPYIALARQVCQYIAIYRTHSAHFYELRINYEDLGGPIFPVKIQLS